MAKCNWFQSRSASRCHSLPLSLVLFRMKFCSNCCYPTFVLLYTPSVPLGQRIIISSFSSPKWASAAHLPSLFLSTLLTLNMLTIFRNLYLLVDQPSCTLLAKDCCGLCLIILSSVSSPHDFILQPVIPSPSLAHTSVIPPGFFPCLLVLYFYAH